MLLLCSAVCAFAQTRDTPVTTADLIYEGTHAGAKAGLWMDLGILSAGDNRRDLVVGAPGGPGLFGTVYVIYGGPVNQGTISLTNANATFTGEAAGDLFGSTTAIGNVFTLENTQPQTLLIGAPAAQGGRGAVYAFDGNLGSAVSFGAGQAQLKIIGAAGDQLGTAIATADLDNDGYREIVLGAPGNNRVYIIKGGPSLSGTIDLSTTAATVTLTLPGIGSVMTAGDLTGDNIQDLILGAPAYNVVYLFNGATGQIPTSLSAEFVGLDTGDQMGASVRLLDIDADGHRDLLIGAPGGDGPNNTRTDAGEVYLIYGGTPLTSRTMFAADAIFYGQAPGDHLGAQLAAGDINRDTPNDAVMLASGAATANGILYVYYGRGRGNVGTALANGQRIVDFAIDGQADRRIGSGSNVGPITSVQVFEVTGEGARDIMVGVAGFNSSTGRVYFTISPKLTISDTSFARVVPRNGAATASLTVVNASPLSITWSATSNQSWLTVSPSSGGAVQGSDGTLTLTASASGLAPGPHAATVAVQSTSSDLTMSIPVTFTFTVTDTEMQLDGPADHSTVSEPFNVGGWALDRAATSGSGIDAIHIWAFPTGGGTPVFLGVANSGGSRPDVGSIFGQQFASSGFNIQVTGLSPGNYFVAVYAHNAQTGTFDATQVVTVTVAPSAAMSVDTPQSGARLNSSFPIVGWAIDAASATGTGVDAIHVWAFPQDGRQPVFLGVATLGDSRPDVGNLFGSRFTNSGYHLGVTNLAPGDYIVVVYVHSSVSNSFTLSRGVPLTVLPTARMSLDVPGNGASVGQPFAVAGWAVDLAATSGTGVDQVHVWATSSNGTATFLGVASYGAARGDVGSVYGSRFTNSAFNLSASGLAPGTYTISVYAHSTVTNSFNDLATAAVTIH